MPLFLVFFLSFAIKKLKTSIGSEMRKQFLECNEFREAKILYSLSSTETVNIVQYVDCFFDKDNYFYLVSEFCEVTVRFLYQILNCKS